MSFPIPLSARASLNRIHKEGLPPIRYQDETVVTDAGEAVVWRGLSAVWTRAEKQAVAGLPAAELAVIHELKSTFDAVLTDPARKGTNELPACSQLGALPERRHLQEGEGKTTVGEAVHGHAR